MCTLTISFFLVTLDIKENDKPNEPWFDLFKKKKKDLKSRLIRTRHGQEAMILETSYKLSIYDYQLNEKKIEFTLVLSN